MIVNEPVSQQIMRGGDTAEMELESAGVGIIFKCIIQRW